ncbi:HlyD family type I secretion periplasmic adaptor subunit [Blastochloris tepida]|uniref:Membrane fusion protein (MFP) family protein n=1 Tax=Blastochloris tepida TaxID=2233851 RepID=A0A348G046_9HYPH|nr:hypothetical protein BLTE_16140 [Blastochloris tepida]
MKTKPHAANDPGLLVLGMLFRLRNIPADFDMLAPSAGAVDVPAMLRFARAHGLKARAANMGWKQLQGAPLPAIAALTDGSFLLVGRVADDRAIVVAPTATRPAMMTRDEFEAAWSGQIVLITPRSAADARLRRWASAAIAAPARLVQTLAGRIRRLANPMAAREAAQRGATAASGVIIDFAERARKLQNAVAPKPRTSSRRTAEELAFLPAALEIVETPPSPIGRGIIFSLIAIIVAALAWSSLGTVDIVAVAQGKIIPSGRTKTIQPFETGIVRAIHVSDGQRVKAGDVLIELDPTMNAAELGRLRADLLAARLEVARLHAALNGGDDPVAAFAPPADAPADLVQMQRRFLLSQITEQKAKIAAIDRQVAQREAERATIRASIDKLKATMTPLQQRVEIREHLFQKELGSKIVYLSEMQELIGQRQEILVQESRYSEAEAAIASLVETRNRAVAEYERGLFDEFARAEQRVAGLAQDIIKAEQRTSLQKLTAPVDGKVQQLAVHTIGGVVTPAQTLMLIVPAESRLEIEAMISNRDIGFVEVGQEVAIKVDAFNFTRYGLLHGRILSISQDSITRDRGHDRDAASSEPSSEPKGQELAYAAHISLDRTEMDLGDKRVSLSPGMAITAEVKTGSRRIISYLLSPLVRYKQESLRER